MKNFIRRCSVHPLIRIRIVFPMAAVLLPLLLGSSCSDRLEESETPFAHQSLEEKFQQSMSEVVLEGFFKTSQSDSPIVPEKYSVSKVSKLAGDYWIFHSRIQYGNHDVTLPVPVTVKFAGETPVLTLDEATLPGLGTFSARVLFFDQQYVGIWRHGEHSGQHFGRVIPLAKP